MEIGIYTSIFQNRSLEKVFQQITDFGIHSVQFDLMNVGLETIPNDVPDEILEEIKRLADLYQIKICSLAGTFNMIDRDINARKGGIRRFDVLCRVANALSIPIVTLCTGTRSPIHKWHWDDANLQPDAWDDLLRTAEALLKSAETYNIICGVETESGNVVNTAKKARRFIDTMGPHFKIIMDGANLFEPGHVKNMQEVLNEAFDYLGKDIVLVHAKDIAREGKEPFVACGTGLLDYDLYIELLRKYKYNGPLMLHTLGENQVQTSIDFLRGKGI